MSDCIFCKIVAGELKAEIVYESDAVLAFLDAHPSSRGHALVIPKTHAEGLRQLPEGEVGPLFAGVRAVMGLLEAALDPAGLTLGWNHGWAAGQRVGHLHVHVIPRYAGDGGAGIQVLVRGSVPEDLGSIAAQIRASR